MIKRRRKLYKAGVLGGGTISGAQRLQTYLDAINANKVGNLLMFLPLNETSGAEALDSSGNDYHADYFGAGLTVGGVSSPLAGNAAPDMNGVANVVRVNSAGWLAKATGLNLAKGHISVWFYADTYNTTTQRKIAHFWPSDAATFGYIFIFKHTTANTLRVYYDHTGGLGLKVIDASALGGAWVNLQMSWKDDNYDAIDNNNGQMRVWLNGTELTPAVTVSGVNDGATIPDTNSFIGAGQTLGTNEPWLGSIALFAAFDEPQDAASVAALYNLPGGVQS